MSATLCVLGSFAWDICLVDSSQEYLLMLLVVDLSQDCGSIVLHASFDANPLPPVSYLVNIFIVYVLLAAASLTLWFNDNFPHSMGWLVVLLIFMWFQKRTFGDK